MKTVRHISRNYSKKHAVARSSRSTPECSCLLDSGAGLARFRIPDGEMLQGQGSCPSIAARGASPEGLTELIALYLLQQGTVSSLLHAPSLPDQMDDVLEFIEEHLAEDLPLKRLGRIANFSPYHFARLFRRTVGQSPHEYIIGRRVERSRYLLLTTDWTLATIAIEAGFASGSHLALHFKKTTGVPPRQFRKEHGKTLKSRSHPFQARGYYDGTQGSQ